MSMIFVILFSFLAILSPGRPFVLVPSPSSPAFSLSTPPFRTTSVSSSSRSTLLFSETRALPDALERLVAGFERMGDEKIRYKQLLFLATKVRECEVAKAKTSLRKVGLALIPTPLHFLF